MAGNRLIEAQERLGATFREVGNRRVPARYARDERTHVAVRAGVGVTEHPWGLLVVEGEDRHSFLDDTLTCRVPPSGGDVAYGFLLDPHGRIETDLYVANAEDALVCLTPAATTAELASFFSERTFIQDVSIDDRSDDHVVFGVHGPGTIEKLRSVCGRGTPPTEPLRIARVTVRDEGVTLVRIDAPTAEPGVAVVCRRPTAPGVLDALINLGAAAVPFGYDTWEGLTLEAGTPLYEHELAGRQPNTCGQVGYGVDLAKGCFVGQEVVARIANLSAPRDRLVGLRLERPVSAGTPIEADGDEVGGVTRSFDSPTVDRPIGMAVLAATAVEGDRLTAIDGGDRVEAAVTSLPFVAGAEGSLRTPVFEGGITG